MIVAHWPLTGSIVLKFLQNITSLNIHPITSNAKPLCLRFHFILWWGPTRPGRWANSPRQVGQLAPVVVIPLFFNPDKTLGSRFPKLREYVAKTKDLLPIYVTQFYFLTWRLWEVQKKRGPTRPGLPYIILMTHMEYSEFSEYLKHPILWHPSVDIQLKILCSKFQLVMILRCRDIWDISWIIILLHSTLYCWCPGNSLCKDLFIL